jgi:hypothetical protein
VYTKVLEYVNPVVDGTTVIEKIWFVDAEFIVAMTAGIDGNVIPKETDELDNPLATVPNKTLRNIDPDPI